MSPPAPPSVKGQPNPRQASLIGKGRPCPSCKKGLQAVGRYASRSVRQAGHLKDIPGAVYVVCTACEWRIRAHAGEDDGYYPVGRYPGLPVSCESGHRHSWGVRLVFGRVEGLCLADSLSDEGGERSYSLCRDTHVISSYTGFLNGSPGPGSNRIKSRVLTVLWNDYCHP